MHDSIVILTLIYIFDIYKWNIKHMIPLKIRTESSSNRVLREILVKTHFSDPSYHTWLSVGKYLSIFICYGEPCCRKSGRTHLLFKH